jgi:hypothetical protein
MGTETAKTLSLVAGIIFMIQFASLLVAGLSFYFFFPQLLTFIALYVDPATLALLTAIFTMIQLVVATVMVAFSAVDLLFGILTLRWRHEPFLHKTGLIVVGVLALISAGVLPGILALVAGATIESK